ncbi:DUF551 domain-containing protein [Enterobacter cloacae]|uniref:DUF551 domain-containing protein n=1 Tax=Enterobacter cloacae TaxID=550 RepID=UPI000BA8B865|nr:DUF551 domain-containing protein [Enterobacter cloacae]PAN73856.1 hypothetical protein CIW70_05480 [Enterobacter cloacae]
MSNIDKQAVQAVADLKAGYTLGHADVEILNELARIALASLEAEPVCVIDQSNIDYLKSGSDADVWPASRTEMGDVLLYRDATPAPVVPDMKELVAILDWILMLPCPTPKATLMAKRLAVVIDACRAAMLQGAEPVTKAYKLPFEQWLSQQTGTIDVECGCVMTEVFFHWLRVAYEAGNSPATPDGWVACSERMPDADGNYWGWWSESKRQGPVWFIKSELQAQFQSSEITHWMPLPAAPQQEV